MSNIFQNTGERYFQVPEYLMSEGLVARLSPSALRMYLLLLNQAQRYSRPALEMADSQFCDQLALSPNSVRSGRKALLKAGLTSIKSVGRGAHEYRLANPTTLVEIPNRREGKTPRPKLPVRRISAESHAEAPRGLTAKEFVASLEEADINSYFEKKLAPAALRKTGSGYQVRCPFHEDRVASLSINTHDAVWNCHAGCGKGGLVDFEKRLNGGTRQDALYRLAEHFGRLDLLRRGRATPEAIYEYTDESGALLHQVLRFPNKRFQQRQPDPIVPGKWIRHTRGVRHVLYNLPKVIAADYVFVTEGEKDADSLSRALPLSNIAVTTNPGGAKKWRSEYSEHLRDKKVLIFPDNDAVGLEHARSVAESVERYAASVAVIQLPDLAEKGDVTDFLEEFGHERLTSLVEEALLNSHRRNS